MEGQGSTALVTGAAAGIGRAIAIGLATKGASVIAADLDADGAADTAAAVRASGRRGDSIQVDVADDDAVRRAVEFAHTRYEGLRILVNNAGIQPSAYPFGTYEEWSRVLKVNLFGVMSGIHYGVRAMREGSEGSILNIGCPSGLGLTPYYGPDHAASKAAVNRLTAALGDLSETCGIRINAICPDWVDTPMVRTALRDQGSHVRRELVPVERVAAAAVAMIFDKSLSGRLLNCPVHAKWTLLSVE